MKSEDVIKRVFKYIWLIPTIVLVSAFISCIYEIVGLTKTIGIVFASTFVVICVCSFIYWLSEHKNC